MSTTNQTIAFFGATGGCASTSLAAALRAGYTCTALVRTPTKLINILTTEHNISTTTIDSLLTIYEGNIKDASAVAKTLISPLNAKKLADTIYFGVGGSPRVQWSLRAPLTNDDPNVCEDGMRTIFTALSTLSSSGISNTMDGRKPLLTLISTTGVTQKSRDVPLILYPLYHWALTVAHEDKRNMESIAITDSSSENPHVRDVVIVRPTLLTSGEARGIGSVRAGWEWAGEDRDQNAPGPQMGWYIGRKDIGEWIFQRVIKEGGRDGKAFSLTY